MSVRLTLRTLLNFLDGVLEGETAQDVGKRIEASQFAASVVNRIRDVTRRIRLAAPGLHERGPNLDPNTVAEYLDNTLSDDRVPDFEKVCLESDMHLAEVASCHQILTLVLGEPAEVDEATKRRMYQVPQLSAAREAAAEKVGVPEFNTTEKAAPPKAESDDGKPRVRHEVPDYLREPAGKRRRLLPGLAAIVLLVGFAALVLFALGQFESERPLGRLLSSLTNTKAQVDESTEPGPTSPASTNEQPKPSVAPAEQPATVAQPAVTVPPSTTDKPPVEPAPTPVEPAPTKPVTTPVEPAPLPPSSGDTKVPSPPPPAVPAEVKPAETRPTVADVTMIPSPEVTVPAPKTGPAETPPKTGPAETPSTTGPAMTPPKTEPAPAQPEIAPATPAALPVGRFVSEHQVLLQFDSQLSKWVRVPPKAVLSPCRVLSLPSYSPEVGLNTGVTVRLLGGTQVDFLPSEGPNPPGLKIAFGRAVLLPLANPGVRLRIVVGSRAGTITFVHADSVAGIDVTPLRVAGTDPEKERPQLNVSLLAASGELIWEEVGAAQPVKVTAPAQLALFTAPAATPNVVDEMPKWVAGEPLGMLEARASAVIEQAVQNSAPADKNLLELCEHRQREVRWLAARCLVYLGRFDALVSALNVADAKADWPDYVAKLTEAIALGPENAAAVRAALEKQYGENAADLYRMLWGYSQKDLENGEDAKLVHFLEHENLAFRVLAFSNLRELTGLGLMYRPELTAAQRKTPVQKWKEKLQAGEIRSRAAEVGSKHTPPAGNGEDHPSEGPL